jgi:hypothetical protein
MVSASFTPLLALARLAGASALATANVGLAMAIVLLTIYGCGPADRPSCAAGNFCSPPRLRRRWGW